MTPAREFDPEELGGMTEAEYNELLDRFAPRIVQGMQGQEPADAKVQGCAPCGYDPDYCSCGKYDNESKEGWWDERFTGRDSEST